MELNSRIYCFQPVHVNVENKIYDYWEKNELFKPRNNKKKYSLVIPCYNEAKNLPSLLESCAPVSETSGVEIILVNNDYWKKLY